MDLPIAFLAAVVDRLLPGLPATERAAALPAASEIAIDRRLRQHLRTHPDRIRLARALEAIAQRSGSAADFVTAGEAAAQAILQQVESSEPDAFAALLFVVSADYYEAEAVLRAFGWRVTPPQPQGYSLPPFSEDLLAPVKQRPALWRSAEGDEDREQDQGRDQGQDQGRDRIG